MIIVGLAQAVALVLMAAIFDGISLSGFGAAVLTVAALAVIGALVWPVVIQLTLPIITITVGLFTFVLNGLVVLGVDALIDGFAVAGFWWALLAAVGRATARRPTRIR